MTQITLVGNLTADPELKFTPSGAAVANFTVAVNERVFDKATNKWETKSTSFYTCEAWRNKAEAVAGELRKGQPVILLGKQVVRQYEKRDGSKGVSVDIEVEDIGALVRSSSGVAAAPSTTAQPTAAATWGQPAERPF